MGTGKEQILIDTSAWIDFLREGAPKHPDVAHALESGRAAMCAVTWAELWAGARGKREESVLKDIRDACGWLEIDERVWQVATDQMKNAISHGWTCPLADALIVACALLHGAIVLHSDKHIEALIKLKSAEG